MRSDEIKRGVARAPHRSLLRALAVTDAEMERPFVGVVNAFSEVVPGHMHLRSIVDAVKGDDEPAADQSAEGETAASEEAPEASEGEE